MRSILEFATELFSMLNLGIRLSKLCHGSDLAGKRKSLIQDTTVTSLEPVGNVESEGRNDVVPRYARNKPRNDWAMRQGQATQATKTCLRSFPAVFSTSRRFVLALWRRGALAI